MFTFMEIELFRGEMQLMNSGIKLAIQGSPYPGTLVDLLALGVEFSAAERVSTITYSRRNSRQGGLATYARSHRLSSRC